MTSKANLKEDPDTLSESPPLSWSYRRIPLSDLIAESKELSRVEQECEERWEAECALYGELIPSPIDPRKKHLVPRRNYPNNTGTVSDPSMYPYHTACYPLLDAYDHLEHGSERTPEQDASVINPSLRSIVGTVEAPVEHDDEIFLPCSEGAIVNALLKGDDGWRDLNLVEDVAEWLKRIREHHFDSNFRHDNEAKHHAESSIADKSNSDMATASNSTATPTPFNTDIEILMGVFFSTERPLSDLYSWGPQHLPKVRTQRVSVLLNIIQHSMSELQRDLLVATAAVAQLQRHFGFDSVDCLRRLLLILRSEHVGIEAYLHEMDDVDDEVVPMQRCHAEFIICLEHAISFGMTWFSRQHAVMLSSFVSQSLMMYYGTPANFCPYCRCRDECSCDKASNDSKKDVSLEVLEVVVCALGARVTVERRRLVQMTTSTSMNESEDEGSRRAASPENRLALLDSYLNCLSALVEIGEACIFFMSGTERIDDEWVPDVVVEALGHAFCDTGTAFRHVGGSILDDRHDELTRHIESPYVALKHADLFNMRMTNPLRYANRITHATEEFRRLPKPIKITGAETSASLSDEQLRQAIDFAIRGRPHEDFRTVVRGLFVHDMVNVSSTGLGYGDFLLFSRFDISPLDPLLWWRYCSYPNSDDDEDEEDDEDEQVEERIYWDVDEEDHLLGEEELRDRHDISLMALMRAWKAPWTPGTHMSFQPAFRRAVESVVLCTYSLGMPKEIAACIIEFMNRDWWPDERQECWMHDCQSRKVALLLERKSGDRGGKEVVAEANLKNFCRCASCEIPSYCNDRHRERDRTEGHRHRCGRRAFRVQGKEEERFFAEILEKSGKASPITDEAVDHGSWESSSDIDDDGSWESIDEDGSEESHKSRITQSLHSYFKKNSR